MKKNLLMITAAFCASIGVAQNTVPNGNFENWVPVPYMEPQYYDTGNDWAVYEGYTTTEQVTDAYHGTYAVKMTTQGTATDTLTAYFANGDPMNTVGQGVPYSEMATGLRGYYKSAIMTGDSANIFVFFKKNGVTIGEYVYKLTGTQSSYTLFNFTFSPALGMAPDTMIWGATPSNALSGNFKGIPGSMLQLDSVSFTGVATQPSMMNGSFETWTASSILTLPGWELDDVGTPQSTDSYSGMYALELQTTMQDWGVNNGFATTGQSTQTGTVGGHPYNIQQDTLAFYYKYTAADVDDSASVSLMFKLNGAWIGNYYEKLRAEANYAYFEVPFNLGQAPDSVVISFNSSKTWPVPASYVGAMLKVDDVHFKSQMAPVAGFTISNTTVCANESVTLTDTSTNTPSGWTWTLTGATPSTSNVQNPVISYAAAGTYTITLVASNGAGTSSAVSHTVTVLAQPTVGINFTPNDTVCTGTSVTLTGTGTPNSVWTGGITDNTAFTATSTATYIVTGTAGNNCTNTDTITITVNPLPIVTFGASPNDTVCDGDMVTLSGSGAVSYTWTGSVNDGVAFTPSSSATYTVTGTDVNGCSNTATASVTVNQLPLVTFAFSPNDTVCDGDMVTLTGSGAVSYTWTGSVNDGVAFTPSATATYTVTGTDVNGCMNSASVEVTVFSLPNVGFTANPGTTVCDTDALTLSGTGAVGYTWDNGVTDGVAFTPVAGDYVVTGIDANGCVNTDTATIIVTTCLGIENVNTENYFSVFPNPFTGTATIQLSVSAENTMMSVVDVTGRQVRLTQIPAGVNAVMLSRDGLENGIYFVRIVKDGKVTATAKVIVE